MKKEILKRLIQNEAATQKVVYYQHADRLMAIVLRYLPVVAEAEDVLQDSFIQIFEKIETYDIHKGSFETWSAKISINYALMFLRKKKSLIFYEEDLHAQQIKTNNNAMNRLENEDVEMIIQKLDEKYAIIFKLKAIEGYKHQEIAQILGIKKEASRTIFSRAKKQLKQMLTNKEPNLFTSNKSNL